MKNSLWVGSVLLLSLGLAVGCGDGDGDDNGSGGSNTGGTGTGGTNTGGTNSGGASTGGTNAGGSPSGGTAGEGGFGGGLGGEGGSNEAVAACEAILDGNGGCDESRECNYDIARTYCSIGDTSATLAMGVCFALNGGCHTPADPGNDTVRTCFETVIEEEGTTVSADLRAAANTVCDDGDYEPLMLEVFAVMAGEDLAEGFVDCVEAVGNCADIQGCIEDNLGLPLPSSCE